MKEDDSKISLAKLMSVDAKGLRLFQYESYKKHVLGIFSKISQIINDDGDITEIIKMVKLSPAGDGYGENDYFINFGIPHGDENFKRMNIMDACKLLLNLRTGQEWNMFNGKLVIVEHSEGDN